MSSSELTMNDVVLEMSNDKKECLYFLTGYALKSQYKKRETVIKHCSNKVLPIYHRKVKDVLREMRDSEDLVVIFMIKKALEMKGEKK